MHKTLESLVRHVFVFLLFFLCWSLWAQDQTQSPASTPPPAPTVTIVQADPANSVTNVWLTFGLNRIPALQSAPYFGIPLWQFFASLIYVFLAFYFSKMLDRFIVHRVRKWAERTTTKVDDLLINLLRGPIRVVSFVILLHIGIRVYQWPSLMAEIFTKALHIIVAVSITYVMLKFVDLMLGVWAARHTTEENADFGRQLLPLIGKSLKVFVVIVVILVTSQNLGLNVTGLIASLSIGGLAMGLAAQDTLANLFGAVAVLADKPFKVGDRIQLDALDGTVESIGFRSTRVRNLDGFLVTVPNKTMGNATIVNVAARPNIKTTMNIGLTYDTPAERVERAIQIIEEVYRSHPKTSDLIVSFNKFESSALNIMVVHWWNSTDGKEQLAGLQKLNLELKRRFDAEKIEFAFPTQTLHVKSGELPVPAGAGKPDAG